MGVLNMLDPNSFLMVKYADGVSEIFNFVRDGYNAATRVIVSKPNVQQLQLIFSTGSGAVTELTFCTECGANPGHDNSHGCIISGNDVNLASEVIEENDFENVTVNDPLSGWVNGRLEHREASSFSSFVGLYITTSTSPHKVFLVPRNA
jgi:hypothetical protein